MNKKKASAYDHVTPELVGQVKDIIADAVKHNYSTSSIYGAHNAVFKRNDKPQTCGSCLRNRVRELKRWLAEYEKSIGVRYINSSYGNYPPAPQYEQVYELQDGSGLYSEIGREEPPLCTKEGHIVEDGEYTIKDEDGKDYAVLTLKKGFIIDSRYVVKPQYSDPDAPGFVLPAPGIKRIYMAEGLPFDITPDPEDENKGTALYADGTKIKAGTYTAAHGVDIAVQPGGKITIKKIDEEEDLT